MRPTVRFHGRNWNKWAEVVSLNGFSGHADHDDFLALLGSAVGETGKVRLVQSPWVNHQWHVTLYVTSRGLTTSPIPHGVRTFQIDFDFIDHRLWIHVSDGNSRSVPLASGSVADFYAGLMNALTSLDIQVTISPMPVEVEHGIRFDQDRVHTEYDARYVDRYRRVLQSVSRVLERYRTPFVGKSSPVHFFWGSFDLATTRYSGRPAPPRTWPAACP